MGRIERLALILFVTLGLAYILDYVSIRFKIPASRHAFTITSVRETYAVSLKNGKTEYMPAGDQDVTCVNSVFPQMGYAPCWYAVSAKRSRVEAK